MAKGDIRLDEEYGVNPTILVCFWCGKDRGDLALLGKLTRAQRDALDAPTGEAPRRMVLDTYPCDACRAKFDQGILLMEAVREYEKGVAPLGGGFVTGRYSVLKVESLPRLGFSEEIQAQALLERRLMLDRDVYERLLGGVDQD